MLARGSREPFSSTTPTNGAVTAGRRREPSAANPAGGGSGSSVGALSVGSVLAGARSSAGAACELAGVATGAGLGSGLDVAGSAAAGLWVCGGDPASLDTDPGGAVAAGAAGASVWAKTEPDSAQAQSVRNQPRRRKDRWVARNGFGTLGIGCVSGRVRCKVRPGVFTTPTAGSLLGYAFFLLSSL